MAQEIFKRKEIKYLLTREQYTALRERIAPYMQVDEYGLSRISNIYFDTDNYDLIRESLDKPFYKEKMRLRAYGRITADSPVFLELKKKYDGIVYKRRVKLSLSEAKDFLFEGKLPDADSQVLYEIKYFMDFYKPEKATFISYDRVAMFGKEDPNLRITFDENLRVAFDRGDIQSGREGRRILDEDEYLMEIKVNSAMPLWLTRALSELSIFPTSFSKYGRACMEYMDYGKCDVVAPSYVAAVKPEERRVNLRIKKFA